MGEKVNKIDFSETVAAFDVKAGRSSQLNDLMKPCEYQKSRSFCDLFPKSLKFVSPRHFQWGEYSITAVCTSFCSYIRPM